MIDIRKDQSQTIASLDLESTAVFVDSQNLHERRLMSRFNSQ